ncbi:hypothetical protein [Larkinella soli]|uniref:hypothetical protein n=1 Tax=Larkinella soli TaxID=1770527 RepID=UPI000FFCA367|nr:hypothetical protein [Larkinella soli]
MNTLERRLAQTTFLSLYTNGEFTVDIDRPYRSDKYSGYYVSGSDDRVLTIPMLRKLLKDGIYENGCSRFRVRSESAGSGAGSPPEVRGSAGA